MQAGKGVDPVLASVAPGVQAKTGLRHVPKIVLEMLGNPPVWRSSLQGTAASHYAQ